MRLKHLTLHGFKTFAPKTDLLFGEGLTAIVGPNGSGKSNVADAVRWVLGEQSLLNLRAKRTEDLIFAGSSNRAPLGMAEVSITLDNSDRLLPLDFSEVTLTRRAFRTGENEYYLNRSRVRLKDIQEIAASLGQAYTVVGQGLVDAALSLKPEERRELFEEAAEIRGYFMQREDALRRLSRTEENTTRINDLLSELEPQVKRMERQARQAEEYGKLKHDLLLLLRQWYGSRWAAAIGDLAAAELQESAAECEVARLKEGVAAANAALAGARSRSGEQREALARLQQERLDATQRIAAMQGERGVLEERLASAAARHDALLTEQADLVQSRAALEHEAQALDAEQEDHSSEIAALQAEEREVATRLAGLDAELAEAVSKLQSATAEWEQLERSVSSLDSRIADATRKLSEGASAAAEAETAVTTVRALLDTETARISLLADVLAASRKASQVAHESHKSAESKLAEARADHAAAESNLRDLARRDDALHSQEVRMDAERQAGLYGGVRAVVTAAREGKLEGVCGTVAELVRVPAHLELAVEAALGGRLQEVVVERWADAERAIAHLKGTGAGRATFLPLDTLRVSSTPNPPTGKGILGVAANLVEHDPSLATLARAVLGRLLLVESLPDARRVLSSLPQNSPWTLATLEGEVVRPGGSVTGGSLTRPNERGGGRTLLARERERRELAAARARLHEELEEVTRAHELAGKTVAGLERDLQEQAAALSAAREREATAHAAHLEGEAALDRLKKDLAWRESLLANAGADLEAARALRRNLQEEIDKARAALTPAAERLASAKSAVAEIETRRDSLIAATGESRTRLAVLAEVARNSVARRRDLESRLRSLDARNAEVERHLRENDHAKERLTTQQAGNAADLSRLSGLISSLQTTIEQSERDAVERDTAVTGAEAALSSASSALLEAETAHSRASVWREHCAGALDTLWVEIVEELRAVSTDALAADDEQWAMEDEVTQPDPVDPPLPDWRTAPGGPSDALTLLGIANDEGRRTKDETHKHPTPTEGLDRRIHSLRARLARIGPVNPLAGEEYTALLDRHSYLQGQLTDLLSAADHLKRIITELDRAMSERFAETFARVNEAFGHFFSTLFGGGAARLELTDPHDLSQTGIEISAQPPGKRMQPLSALSGGERALTSAALLFALLKVRPVPFCVLDEVDAALDESNVVRFRDALQELGTRTQFVVVTHNRGTIEAASTLYGVSMAGDGTSKLLSLKVG
jgi:chromosome segregation protein